MFSGSPTTFSTLPCLTRASGHTDAHTGSNAGASITIQKAAASVTFGNMTQAFTGSPLSPAVTTDPAGLNVVLSGAPPKTRTLATEGPEFFLKLSLAVGRASSTELLQIGRAHV